MATKRIKIFLSLSIIFYLFIVIYLIYSLSTIRTAQFEAASDSSTFINSEIDSAYSVDHSFSSDFFRNKISDVFSSYNALSGIILTTEEGRIEYLKITDGRILGGSNSGNFNPEQAVNEIVPVHALMKVFNSKLFLSDGKSVNSFIVFDLLDRNLFFPVLRNSLIIVMFYITLSVLFLVLNNNNRISTVSSHSAEPVVDNDPDFQPEESILPETIPQLEDDSSNLPADDIDSSQDQSKTAHTEVPGGMYSERSGLVWAHFLNEKLDAELKRAASFDQDSCLVFLSIKSPSGFIPYRNIAELIISHFTYKDLAFESGENTFCVIIPEKDIDEGQIEVEKFKKSLVSRFPDSSYKIFAGITSRNSRLLSEKRMIQEAKAALNKAEDEKDSTTIAFRTDLNKYREYIASTV